jgi:methylene-tetrahydromethanopterin dehydrogenase
MANLRILHMLTPLKHMSPFDVNMALDAGFDVTIPYTSVTIEDVTGLVQDAIFSRGPEGVKRTGVFIGGKRAIEALDMMKRAKSAMVPPFEISVFADPAGSFTTAAAMVACAKEALRDTFSTELKGKCIAVFGGTGVVGFASAVIASLDGASATLIGYDGPDRVRKLAEEANARFSVNIAYADGGTEEQKNALVREAEVIFAAGPAGKRLLTLDQLKQAKHLHVVADVNAVPPSGVEGLGVNDDATPIPGTGAVGIGALAVGNVKYRTEAGLFRQMIESERPLYLDFRDAYALAQKLACSPPRRSGPGSSRWSPISLPTPTRAPWRTPAASSKATSDAACDGRAWGRRWRRWLRPRPHPFSGSSTAQASRTAHIS